MTNVSPGDIAIVIGCPNREFNGATCEVLGQPQQSVPSDFAFSGVYWHARFGRDMPWMSWAGDMTPSGREGAFPDQFLRKIGGPQNTRLHTRELEMRWKRALSDEEMALITTNPWQIFEKAAA